MRQSINCARHPASLSTSGRHGAQDRMTSATPSRHIGTSGRGTSQLPVRRCSMLSPRCSHAMRRWPQHARWRCGRRTHWRSTAFSARRSPPGKLCSIEHFGVNPDACDIPPSIWLRISGFTALVSPPSCANSPAAATGWRSRASTSSTPTLCQQGYGSRPTRGGADFGSGSFPFPFPSPGGKATGSTGGSWRDPSSRGGWSPGGNKDFSTGGSF